MNVSNFEYWLAVYFSSLVWQIEFTINIVCYDSFVWYGLLDYYNSLQPATVQYLPLQSKIIDDFPMPGHKTAMSKNWILGTKHQLLFVLPITYQDNNHCPYICDHWVAYSTGLSLSVSPATCHHATRSFEPAWDAGLMHLSNCNSQ